MKLARLLVLVLAASAARADFSYTSTRKAPSMPGVALDQTSKHYFKGDKMMTDSGNTALIFDFDTQTVTNIDRARKTYTVSKFSDFNAGAAQDVKFNMSADLKETGQHKTISGFNTSESVMTIQIDTPQTQQAGMKMEMEMSIWLSPDVPGYAEMEGFYKRNMSRFPWGAMAEGANPSVRAAMAELQKKMAAMHGAPVLEVIRMKMGGAGAPTLTPQQQAQLEKTRAQMEAMQKQGGPEGAAAAQALARMGALSGGGGGMEITSESGGFSSASVPDSVFAIPADFKRITK